jgi:transcriptional regulator with XRE-family HTH domain
MATARSLRLGLTFATRAGDAQRLADCDASGACISQLPSSPRGTRLAANGSPKPAGASEPVTECGAPFATLSKSPNSRWGRSASPDLQALAVDAAWSGGPVGIDVAKDRLDVHLRPSAESFVVTRDGQGLEPPVARLVTAGPGCTGQGTVMSSGKIAAGQRSRRRVGPSDVDRHVGERIRKRRIAIDLSQRELAGLIGISPQQSYQYERGVNRLTAGRLQAIARALDVDIGYFFIGLERPAPRERDLTFEFWRAFFEIREKRLREGICLLARMLAEQAEE